MYVTINFIYQYELILFMNNIIVDKNLEKMVGNNGTDMPRVLMSESIGGNAGRWEGRSCIAANFYADRNTGEIIAFGNLQDLPKNYITQYAREYFRLAIDINRTWKYRVVEFSGRDITYPAKETIDTTIEEYNTDHGYVEYHRDIIKYTRSIFSFIRR